MKTETTILFQEAFYVPARRLLTLLLAVTGLLIGNTARSQCSNPVTLNWDYLDYFTYTGNYTNGNGYLSSEALATTQNFAFGPANRLTIVTPNGTNMRLRGETTSHTGDANSFATGADVEFEPRVTSATTITLTFEQEVNTVRFSLYDVDQSLRVNVSATNASATAVNVALTTPPGSSITFNGTNPGTNPQARGGAGDVALNSSGGTVNVQITNPVKTITLTMTNAEQNFYLSDITACTAGTFPNNYYQVSQPFSNQPGYVLQAFDKSIYALDPVTGKARHIYTDPDILGMPSANNRCYINSMAYDPYNKILYYVFSLSTNPGGNRQLRKYDFNTDTKTILVNDITATLSIPVSSHRGVESGAAAFYNGALYLGIENTNGDENSGRENVIYRIDFNGSNLPYRASQVFAVPADNGNGTLTNDWADFFINDGVLYNFDGAGVTTQTDVYQQNMITGGVTQFALPSGWTPGQPTVTWNGNMYQLHAATSPVINPYVAAYNPANNTIGTNVAITSDPMYTPAIPSLGDAAEAFRPKSDFGDAPASYDPDPMAPATHEIDPRIRIGASVIKEWNLTSSSLANAEAANDEDGTATPAPLSYGGITTYSTYPITVFNNTGVPATLVAWLDYNFNGIFDPSEGRSVSIPSSATSQNVVITWNNIHVQETTLLRTFLRIRLTRTVNGMTVNNPTGWMYDGEVEDYPVLLGTFLPKDLEAFSAKRKTNATVDVQWSINVTEPVANYEVLRSTDENNWISIGTVATRNATGRQHYSFIDQNPAPGTSYYRVRINYVNNGANKISETRQVKFDHGNVLVRVLPNPAHETAEIQVTATKEDAATIRVYDRNGRVMINLKQAVEPGLNSIRLNNLGKLPDGVYIVRTIVNGRTSSNQLVISKQ